MKKLIFIILFFISCTETKTITLNGSRSYDPDGDSLIYKSWTQLPTNPGGLTIINPNAIITTAKVSSKGIFKIELLVKDPWGAVGKDTTTVTVN